MHIAAAFKRRKIAKLLIDARVNIHTKNKQNDTAVDIARRKDHQSIIDIIHFGVSMLCPGHFVSLNTTLRHRV